MYSMEDILARLQKGESIESIGNEFAEILNQADAANRERIAKEKAEAEAKAEAKAKTADRIEALRDVVNALVRYGGYTNAGDTVKTWADEVSTADLEELDAQLVGMFEMVKALDSLKVTTFPNHSKRVKVSEGTDADKVIADFLRLAGL